MNMSINAAARAAVAVALAVGMLVTTSAPAQDAGGWDWPRVIQSGDATVTMYQPQLDSWDGDTVEARAAVSVKPTADAAPVFGAVWLSARFETDRDTRMVSFTDIRVPSVRFPEATEDQQQKLSGILEKEIPTWQLEISLDELLPTLDLAQRNDRAEAELNNKPPKIVVRYEPAVLILIDGDPDYEAIEGSELRRVANTPYVIVRNGADFYLASNETWFTARDITGPWKATSVLPADVEQIDTQLAAQRRQQEAQQAEDLPDVSVDRTDNRIPEIVVSLEPAELIFIDGNIKMTPVEGGEILFVANTDSDVVFEVASQNYYVLLSGRWYRSKDLDRGPWGYVANDQLAESFARIPTESDMGYLRAHVAGTDEAREAVLEQLIPQTAEIERSSASFTVEYDGEPKFEPIESTEMSYAVNTASSVIVVGSTYYACDQAIWYSSPSANGPWTVAAEIPAEISTIPPSSPVYNVTYVQIYETTPEVVYVGYTPGYTGSYVSSGCVVYGTGWYYRPWWGHYYYARPATWGFHVRWNPWYGWSFGLSYTNGPFRFTLGWGGGYHGGWWGPARYRPYPGLAYGAGYRAGYRAGAWHGAYRGGRPVHYGNTNINNNIYARPGNRDRVVATTDRPNPRPQPRVANDRANNVYTDRNGDVYRRNGDGSWDRRDQGGWSRTDGVPSAGDRSRPSVGTQPATRPSTGAAPSTRPSAGPPVLSGGNLGGHQPAPMPSGGARPSTMPSTGSGTVRPTTLPSYGGGNSLNRDYNARQRSNQRSQQMARPSGGAARSMGGGRRR